MKIADDLKEFFTGECPETESPSNSETYEETNVDDLKALITEINDEIKKAEEHVKMHTAQREEAKKWIEAAQQDEKDDKPMEDRTVTLTMDMSQNGTVPSLSGDQCGDFYYMSPKTQFIFGICNNAKRSMNVYIWGEGTANQGGDNIVSCLYWDLVMQGIIGGTKVKRLVINTDNCSGQNKNFCVLKFCVWLVEAGWAGEVVLHFLIKGHTKNECDSKFNTLKRGTYGINIFTERAWMQRIRKTIQILLT